MTFQQNNWQLHGSKVYNIAGDLHLTEHSSPQEFSAVLDELRARIRALDTIPEADLEVIDAELAETHDDETGDGEAVAGRLTRIANRLRALGGTTTAAIELGSALDTLAQFAGQHF